MRLTSYTDFGLRALLYLATLPEGGTVERGQGIRLVRRIPQPHGEGGEPVGKTGLSAVTTRQEWWHPHGALPDEINIGQVIRALEGNLDGIDCSSPVCHIVSVCLLKSALKEAMNAFLAVMDGYTLQDLLANRDELQQVFGELIPTLVLEPDDESE